jgi:NAD(P)-dependent dehydrogenase (short-subunit alcohol dehydrogenase family)
MKVLITGGASGLGEAITLRCLRDPSNEVCFTYRGSRERAQAIEAEFPAARALPCDFTSEREVGDLCVWIEQSGLDAIVNNAYAGNFLDSHFHKTPHGDFLEAFRANIVPTARVTQAALSTFRKRKAGQIVTVLSSALINVPPAGASVYVAMKACLQGLVKAWASENARYGIASNSVSPAFMETAFTRGVDERLIEQMAAAHPLRRLLRPEEVAEAVYFLCCAGPQVNGIDIALTGAGSMR